MAKKSPTKKWQKQVKAIMIEIAVTLTSVWLQAAGVFWSDVEGGITRF